MPSDEILEALHSCPRTGGTYRVYRYTLGSYPPERPNTRGARWNPPGVSALYASRERETCLAEVEFLLSLSPIRPSARGTLYTLELALADVLDLTQAEHLARFGVMINDLPDDDYSATQAIGGAAEWLEHDGLLVPSARYPGTNLVVLTSRLDPGAAFDVLASEQPHS